ncbi:MAG: single-stranded DNA-binding protein [Actinomyces graevenitzii]|nr:single-stranded DNA-binding protein [Actinomyces graevenitzii]
MSQETVKQLEEEGEVGADYLEELLDIADLGGDIDIDVDHGRASVAIIPGEDGDERELAALVGRDGEVLEALQELTRLAVQARTGSRSRLMLDIAGYREERRQQLTAIAAEAVKSVLASGKPVALEAMNPFERKVCHDVVANAGLVSESEGVEPHRHVVVLPVDDAEDEVDEAEEGAEVAADAVAEAGAAEVGAVESETAEAEAGETKAAESAETVDSPADAVEEA